MCLYMGRKLTQEEFEINVKNRHPNLKILGEYKGSHIKILTKCLTCGYEWMCQPSNIYALVKGTGCPKCGRQRDSINKATSQKKVIEKLKKIFHQYDYSKVIYKNSDTKICVICPKHGEFKQTPNSHLNGSGCPKCKRSKGELLIENILKSKKLTFISQYKVNNFKIDFYIPNTNTFIEYNGAQHYIPVQYFGGEIKFKKQQERDSYIKKYCSENKINLIEIPYTKTEEEIRNMLYEL